MKYTLESTPEYDKWFAKLKDALTKARILARLSRLEKGNLGDFKPLDQICLSCAFSLALAGAFTIPSKMTVLSSCWLAGKNQVRRKISLKLLRY